MVFVLKSLLIFFPGSQTASVFGEMHLIPEPLFSIPSDNVHILSIRNADNGRIFMAGKDGCLYELHYQVPCFPDSIHNIRVLIFSNG